jgi:hypothetical protein
MRVEEHKRSFQIETKRFKMPASIYATCPECGEEVCKDLRSDHLSYPTANAPTTVRMYHYGETEEGEWYEHEWSVEVMLEVRLRVAS